MRNKPKPKVGNRKILWTQTTKLMLKWRMQNDFRDLMIALEELEADVQEVVNVSEVSKGEVSYKFAPIFERNVLLERIAKNTGRNL